MSENQVRIAEKMTSGEVRLVACRRLWKFIALNSIDFDYLVTQFGIESSKIGHL